MIPVKFEGANTVLTRPPDMTEEECSSLYCLRTLNQYGTPVVVSCWEPSKEELDEVIKTGKVWLIIAGRNAPPASIAGFKPFTN